MIFARKMPEFYIIIARKIIFPNFRGHVPPLTSVSYAYGVVCVFSGSGDRGATKEHDSHPGTKRSSQLPVLRPANSTDHLAQRSIILCNSFVSK